MIRSKGARAASIGWIDPVGLREQQVTRSVANGHTIDRGIVARDVDGDRVDVGGNGPRHRP